MPCPMFARIYLENANAVAKNRKEDDYLILIPQASIFALVLQALKLPPAIYRRKICLGNMHCVTVTFNSSLELFDGLLVPTSISGMISNNYEDAEDSVAIEAIRYMENAYGKEITDYNYNHAKKLQNQVTHLLRLPANKTIKKIRRGWHYAVRYMDSYSAQIQNTAAARRFRGQDNTRGVMKKALASIGKLAKRLRYIGMKSEQRLETTNSIW
ncbi:hypothetical protein CFC21_033413 [Triticum aestivum]|uniref:Uncharacterized protein n=2 Tax=Triticum aestivum TaxID=4565 RepID=A0A9R1F0Y2_WHEAT|nr:hypothetical protein CFC21_033412 [Triticum aestivum]KAF7020298.1 hypothetical protein CFC21_033413 [Triticum aestivum]